MDNSLYQNQYLNIEILAWMTKNGPASEKFEKHQLKAFLNEYSAQTLKELAGAIDGTEAAISKHLYAIGKIRKEGK